MSIVLQVSDPHFGTERPAVLEALVALAHRQGPDLVVLSGDITQRARPVQFRAARTFTDRLGAPLLALPGNHDIPLFDLWTRLLRPYARYSEAFGNELEPEHCSADLWVLGVNTTRASRHKNGEISAQQAEHIARRLRQAHAAQLRVVVLHHPVAVSRAQDLPNRVRGHAAAIALWAAAGADLVLGGHIHLPYVMALPGLARPLWAVQAGTAVSTRVRDHGSNSVNLLRWGEDSVPGCCLMEQWDFSETEQAFVCSKVSELRPER